MLFYICGNGYLYKAILIFMALLLFDCSSKNIIKDDSAPDSKPSITIINNTGKDIRLRLNNIEHEKSDNFVEIKDSEQQKIYIKSQREAKHNGFDNSSLENQDVNVYNLSEILIDMAPIKNENIDKNRIEEKIALELFSKINIYRKSKRLQQLRWKWIIADVCKEHCYTLDSLGYLSKDSNEVRNEIAHLGFKDRVESFRYIINFDMSAENVAAAENYPTHRLSDIFFRKWMNSSGHLVNIEKREFNQTGIAVLNHGDKWYAVQIFIRNKE